MATLIQTQTTLPGYSQGASRSQIELAECIQTETNPAVSSRASKPLIWLAWASYFVTLLGAAYLSLQVRVVPPYWDAVLTWLLLIAWLIWGFAWTALWQKTATRKSPNSP